LTLKKAADRGGKVVVPLRSADRKVSWTEGGCRSTGACPVSGKNASTIKNDDIDFSTFSATPEITMPP
jgi:hypothetical protein